MSLDVEPVVDLNTVVVESAWDRGKDVVADEFCLRDVEFGNCKRERLRDEITDYCDSV